MEIQVGEFIRTDNGKIFKVLEVEKGSVKIKSDCREWIGICSIKIHSFNIIDLLEEGDYVNGSEVVIIYGYDEDGNDKDELGIEMVDCDEGYYIPLTNIDIKSIVTKEQFESVKYEV